MHYSGVLQFRLHLLIISNAAALDNYVALLIEQGQLEDVEVSVVNPNRLNIGRRGQVDRLKRAWVSVAPFWGRCAIVEIELYGLESWLLELIVDSGPLYAAELQLFKV
jgi:hypothetical protein